MGMLRTPSKRPRRMLLLYSCVDLSLPPSPSCHPPAHARRRGAPSLILLPCLAARRRFEASPQCRLVREALSSLELPYKLISVPLGSGKRHAFRVRSHGKAIPYLEDPNTDFRGASATATVEYLYRTYQAGHTVQEAMADYAHATEGKEE